MQKISADILEQYQLAGNLTDSKDILALSSLIHYGEILLELGDYETTEMKFAAALQIDPNNSTALLLRQRASNQRVAKTVKRVIAEACALVTRLRSV
jgi:tetratricopeptide (TPR) repeat protein